MLRNLAISLIEHKRISTTLAKAKALRKFVEPIITTSKSGSQHAHREAFKHLQNKEAIKELFGAVAPAVADRPGGYVRVIRTGTRLGDNAETAIIELVDFNETYNLSEKTTGKSRRRRRRGGSGASSASSSAQATSATPDEAESVSAVDARVFTEEGLAPTDDADTASAIGDALVEESNDTPAAEAPDASPTAGDDEPAKEA